MSAPAFDRLYVHEAVRDHPRTKRIVERARCRAVEVVADLDEAYSVLREGSGPFVTGKRSLALAPWRDGRLEACPGSRSMRCCLYRVLNIVEGCPYECTYCILQCYLNRPAIVIYPELEKMTAALEADLAKDRSYASRYGTGELADSLALDDLTGFAGELVDFFGRHPGAWLELKTKSTEVDGLLEVGRVPGNVVVAWSVNAEEVCRSEERGASSLGARLAAAGRVRDAGYRLAFHFDPLFRFHGWERAYREVVRRIYAVAAPGDIAWISLGCFRHAPAMAPVHEDRRASGPFLAGELFPVPPDRKYRYPQPVRVEMYRELHRSIREFDPGVYVYLCMESAAVWRWALDMELDPADDAAVERGFPAPPGSTGTTS